MSAAELLHRERHTAGVRADAVREATSVKSVGALP
jgi:hypothetical protein